MFCYKYCLFAAAAVFSLPAFAVQVSDFSSFYNAYKTGSDSDITVDADISATRLMGSSAMSNINIDFGNFDFNADGFNGFNLSSGTNFSLKNAGQFTVENSSANITKSYHNFAQSLRGGVFINSGGTLTVSDSAFTSNRAGRAGGVFQQASGSNLTVSNSAFSGNAATSGDGGVLNNEYGATATLADSYFQNNTVSRYGGAIYNGGDLTVSGAVFESNQANSGGAIYNNNIATISNSIFKNNVSTDDVGAIYNGETITISSSIFQGNKGIVGGALGNFGIPDSSYSVIKDSLFAGNQADYGGAVFSWDDLYIIDTSFIQNSATDTGGAISNSSNLNLIANNSDMYFYGNTANGQSNAIQTDGTINMNAASGKSITFYDKINGTGSIVINKEYSFEGQTIAGGGTIFLNQDMTGFSGAVEIDGGSVVVSEKGKFFNATDLQVNSGTLNLGTTQATVETANFGASSQLSLEVQSPDVYGALIANSISAENGAVLNIVLDNGLLANQDSLKIHLINSDADISGDFALAINNNIYNFSELPDGWYEIKPKNDIKDDIEEEGGSQDNQDTADAWQDAPAYTSNELTYQVYERLDYLYKNDIKAYLSALTALTPTVAPVVQALSLSYMDNFNRMISNGLSDKNCYELGGLKLWSYASGHDGHIGKHKYYGKMDAYGFNLGLGAEYEIGDWNIGLAYMYQYDNVESWGRVIHAPTNGLGIYTKYNKNNFEWRTSASWFASMLDETKDVGGIAVHSEPELYTYGIESDVAYNMSAGGVSFTPRMGVRYYMSHRSSATDDVGQHLASDDMNSLSSFASIAMQKRFYLDDDFSLVPVLELGGSYDWLNDAANNKINITKYQYTIISDELSRWQANAALKLKAEFGEMFEMSIGAEYLYRENYNEISGNMRAVLKF